ncbi:class I SAM-dependent methyltransferase [Nostoc edaphicum CCNP1411]|uniref:Class I SAM-dependent methyltransferase n=1 Tax=Nostoc edaphicum CCNP1411 TaxID=1472755 RepID=A0A7D7QJZ0_9NOSO|nr:class I SAM-dependent methyltransferase [Nostoc edaphicum]QMS86680.1 class I SAM-dependent methyltransferase [Nostoc edaphicum CCNP1411]
MGISKEELNKIALDYHMNENIPDKHIEDLGQIYTIEWVKKHLQGKTQILELGYGEGIFTNALVHDNYNVTLVEGSSVLIDKAKENFGQQVDYIHCLFEDYVPVKKFDAILALHVLEHIDQPRVLLNQMKQWINDDGVIIVIVPNQNSIHRKLAVIMGLQPALDTLSQRDLLVGHQRVYSLETLEADIKATDYHVIDTTGFFLKVLPNSMMLEYSQDLLMALNEISNSISKDLLANIGVVAQIKNK